MFQIIKLPRDVLLELAAKYAEQHKDPSKRYPKQSGIQLDGVPPELHKHLPEFRGDVQSSCRLQRPDGFGALALHQDMVACGADKSIKVVWVPLTDIDEFTCSLEIGHDPGEFLMHTWDKVGYSILADQATEGPRFAITRMPVGDAVLMTSTTLHRSYVQPWHTKERMSLDLRYKPG